MLSLDVLVDALENEVANKGVLAVNLKQLASELDSPDGHRLHRSSILIEMLRVWMEHRWQAGHPVSMLDCLREFPNEAFSEEELACLRFEEQRLRSTGLTASQKTSSDWSIDGLPNVGEKWGEFELLGILGVGAFAKVYLARQHGLAGRLVALKLTFRETRESQWLAKLQHSAIVPIYSTHCIDRVFGICMPFLGNTTLADLIREAPNSAADTKSHWWSTAKRKQLGGGRTLLSTVRQRHVQIDTIVDPVESVSMGDTPSDSRVVRSDVSRSYVSLNLIHCDYVDSICWIGLQLADALSYAHHNGVIHSDIKPANVLVAFDGQPRLLDFNVSYKRSCDGIVRTDLPIGGTLPYMSPEHRRALNEQAVVDARSDLYSLGVVLHEMLTGRLPNQSSKSADLIQWNSAVSPALSAIVCKCLEDNPNARYQSADALRDDLTAQLRNEPLKHQTEPSTTERLLKWCRRHPRLSSSLSIASLAAVLLIFLVTGVIVRQIALNKADWVHRMDLLRERIPTSMALLTSLDAVPELEPEACLDLQQTFALMETAGSSSKNVDPRWEELGVIKDDLRSDLRLLARLVNQRTWKTSPILPAGLDTRGNPSDERGMDQQTQDIFAPIRAGDFKTAIARLNQRIEQNPRDYVGWWLLGDSYQAEQDFVNAQRAYTVCIALRPNTPIAYLNRGMAHFSAGAYTIALNDYKKVLTFAPTWNSTRFNRAVALQHLGRLTDALTEIDLALQAGFVNVSVYRLRAQILSAMGDAEAAKIDFANALNCDPITDQHWVDRGLIHIGTNPANAAQDFESALVANPKSVDAHQKLAYVYSELLGNPVKGLEHSNRLVELAPLQYTHLAGRAVLHARAGRTQEALDDLRLLELKRIKDPMVNYQAACGYSILAGNAVKRGEDSNLYAQSTFRLFLRSVGNDPNILSIALTDPDVQWMRVQNQFQEIVKAVASLELNRP